MAPATQACAPDRNRTWDPPVRRPTLYPLSHTGRGEDGVLSSPCCPGCAGRRAGCLRPGCYQPTCAGGGDGFLSGLHTPRGWLGRARCLTCCGTARGTSAPPVPAPSPAPTPTRTSAPALCAPLAGPDVLVGRGYSTWEECLLGAPTRPRDLERARRRAAPLAGRGPWSFPAAPGGPSRACRFRFWVLSPRPAERCFVGPRAQPAQPQPRRLRFLRPEPGRQGQGHALWPRRPPPPGSMASAFEQVVKSVVQELDQSRELVPVGSLRSSTSFQPYCLLGRRPPSSWFWRARYRGINLSLRDILEPDDPEPDVQRVGPFQFQDAVDGQLQGRVELTAGPGQGGFSGGAAVSGSSSASMNVCTLRVDPNTWAAMLQERHLRQPEHKVLQQLRSRGDDVFVVTEVLQTQKEVEVTRTRRQEGSGQFALPGATCFQGQGQGHLSRKRTVTIPAGSVLAFQVAQLVITGSDWDIVFSPDRKKRTFEPPPTGASSKPQQQSPRFSIRSLAERLKLLSDGLEEDGQAPAEDFPGLQAEVSAWARGLEGLSRPLCEQLLRGLRQVLRDKPALETLEESLEQGLSRGRAEPLQGPAGDILECLVRPCRTLVEDLAGPIAYLLGALAALSEPQHVLLAEALEAKALSEPFRLVESLLEQTSPWQEPRDLSLPPGLLGSRWGPEEPIWTLLEECGLELQADAPQACWRPEAQGPTCALYACLALLRRLSQLC
ncbi:gasdermin-D isoform X2 [Eptesicus fuscus]|uniref:gasdermin-D isoform X2 n=1 Tax=Eptesicus fuscus TaxID=29078 RepID=UPI0024042665|nr:gasdermin-D isoform X2 [Eptesicus fuscus]